MSNSKMSIATNSRPRPARSNAGNFNPHRVLSRRGSPNFPQMNGGYGSPQLVRPHPPYPPHPNMWAPRYSQFRGSGPRMQQQQSSLMLSPSHFMDQSSSPPPPHFHMMENMEGPGNGPPMPWHAFDMWNSPYYRNSGRKINPRHGVHPRLHRIRSADAIRLDEETSMECETLSKEDCDNEEEVQRMSLLSLCSEEDGEHEDDEEMQTDASTCSIDASVTRDNEIKCNSGSSTTSDSISVTSDEGNSDSVLPRIIKPRKRRKKDRKPSNSSTTSEEIHKDKKISPAVDCNSASGDGKTFVTLKPYVPAFYENNEDVSDGEKVTKEDRSEIESVPSVKTEETKTSECCEDSHPERVCGCEKCVPSHSFPTPPSSPSSSASYSSKITSNESTADTSQRSEAFSSPGMSSSGSDDESWTPTRDRQLVRSYSEPTESLYITKQYAATLNSGNPNKTVHPMSQNHYVYNNNRNYFANSGPSRKYHPNYHPSHHYPYAASRGLNVHRSFVNVSEVSYNGGNGGRWNDGVKYCVNSLNNTIKRRHSLHSSQKSQLDLSQLHQIAERTPAPSDREWVTISPQSNNRISCVFTVMCYNVLCSKYATRQMYGYCPPWALEWEYRKKGIMSEIMKYGADIITLQEVETDAFYNFFLPELKAHDYEGIFSPKSRAKTMAEKDKKHVDGCAIFFKVTKFTLVREHLIEFNQLAMANNEGSEDMLNRVMTKDNIGLAAMLQVKPQSWSASDKSTERQYVLVCTAHIHWDPEFCDVKLIQTIMLMTEVRKIVQEFNSEQPVNRGNRRGHHPSNMGENVQLLLCGDLNSLPESGVVEFLEKGNVSMDHRDFKGHGYKNSLHKLNVIIKSHPPTNPNLYTHSFRLRASYDHTVMPYTNYTYDFKGIIDYIFHSSDTMQTLLALGPIDPFWFKNNKVVGCPHPSVPSDHFPLVVQLEMWPVGSGHVVPPQPSLAISQSNHPNMMGHQSQHHNNMLQHNKNNNNVHR